MGDSGMDDEDETFSAHSSSSITTVSSSRAGCHMSEEECDYDFMACEKGVRMLTANLTHKEADVLLNLPSCNAQRAGIVLQHEIPRSKATHTVLREWALEEMNGPWQLHNRILCENCGPCVEFVQVLDVV